MYNDFLQHIRRSLEGQLPGDSSHRKMTPPGRRLRPAFDEVEKIKYSSVLLLLFPYKNKVFTCLTKRNSNMKNHPGQISFPGGKIEEGESPELTAMREAEEEVGISPLDIELLGVLSELYIPVSGFTIFPYVGWVPFKPDFVLNKDEAEELILFPIEDFLQTPQVCYTEMDTVRGRLTVPYYPHEGKIIWGATAMILTEFLDVMKTASFTPQ